MSLKAKIEAVIYASEEPVTLAQLAGLLGMEAQSELDRIAARQATLHLAEDGVGPEPPRKRQPSCVRRRCGSSCARWWTS